jgi:hypothetical protein
MTTSQNDMCIHYSQESGRLTIMIMTTDGLIPRYLHTARDMYDQAHMGGGQLHSY